MNPIHITIQSEDFDLSAEVAALRKHDGRVGAVCSFVGTVRDRNGPEHGVAALNSDSFAAIVAAAR